VALGLRRTAADPPQLRRQEEVWFGSRDEVCGGGRIRGEKKEELERICFWSLGAMWVQQGCTGGRSAFLEEYWHWRTGVR